ncbi:MAG: alanine--tRNA ligase [Halobacteriota archaeon]|nr:alanine--tRNA ligase [Halobacteriota archaeon]
MMEEEYQLDYFAENGFVRKKCTVCGSFYWSRDPNRITCGDAPCDPYFFIGNPVFKEHNLDSMREFFLSFFERHNHQRVDRYPVIARWRDDIYLTIASIADFQPWVTSGKVPPPANPLTISQPCIRLEDLDSVGKSGRHLTTFEMMAHHAFNTYDDEIYWKEKTLEYCEGLLSGLEADLNKVTYKEVIWSGGGNAGPCVEVLIGGLEVATLVFMNMQYSPDGSIIVKGEPYTKMDRYIVDTGYGLERFVWASKGSPTVYDAIFPEVVNELMTMAGIEHSLEDPVYANILSQNARLSGLIDVRGNLMELREKVAERIGISVERLRSIIEPVETVYAITDHTRCLAFMFGDGIIPSNVKAGYLARLVLRRTLRMMKSLNMTVPVSEIVSLQIENMGAYPKFKEKIDTIVEIVDLEETRYSQTISRGMRVVERTSKEYKEKNESIPLDEIIGLYDTHGIPPEVTGEVASKIGVDVQIPDNFYSLVAQSHSKERVEKKIDSYGKEVSGLPKTRKLYYEDQKLSRFEAVVLDTFDDYIVLDQTLFYPEGGGQPEDEGVISTQEEVAHISKVKDVDGVILHKADKLIPRGELVEGRINFERRMALSRHHTSTHIIHEAAKRALGEHIWQAGAQKGFDRSRLDLSHFKRITPDELNAIEMIANQIVMSDIVVEVSVLDRNEAEVEYGFVLYQGGIPAGDKIRIIKIENNIQACAGTHLATTGEAGMIKILKTERVQDGVERIEFSAGEAAVRRVQEKDKLLNDAADILKVQPEILPETANRFFSEWKELKKENAKLKETLSELRAESLRSDALDIGGIPVIVRQIPDADADELRKSVICLAEEGIIGINASISGGSAILIASVPKSAIDKGIDAATIVREGSKVLGGGGGGKPDLAQGGGPNVDKIDEALEKGREVIEKALAVKKE